VGEGRRGETREVTVRLVNHAGHTVECIGGTANCACMTTDDLPLTLGPGESRPVRVRMKFRGGKGSFQERFVFYTNERDQGTVVTRLAGRTLDPQQ
jgi:hypothetical protein